MNNSIKNEILKHLDHWKDVPNGVVAIKIFDMLSQKENRNKDEFNIEDLCEFSHVNIQDENAAIFGALVVMTDPTNGFLNMYRVYKDTDGKEFKLDFANQPNKHKYKTNNKGLCVLESIKHPETGEIIYNPEERMYFRFSLSDNFKSMFQSQEKTLKIESQKKTIQKP